MPLLQRQRHSPPIPRQAWEKLREESGPFAQRFGSGSQNKQLQELCNKLCGVLQLLCSRLADFPGMSAAPVFAQSQSL